MQANACVCVCVCVFVWVCVRTKCIEGDSSADLSA